MRFFRKHLIFRNRFVNSYFKPLFLLFRTLTLLSSLLIIVSLIYKFGFLVSAEEDKALRIFYDFSKFVYLTYIVLVLIVDRKLLKTKYRKSFWLLSGLLCVSLLFLSLNLLDDNILVAVMALFSVFMLSNGVVRILGKQTNPSFIIAISFLLIIILGSFMLQMPNCTFAGNISWIDSFFISTSAVCVTGLTSVDVPSTFTFTGMAVILLLIQIGGLGVMTFTSFFALFFMGNTTIYNQLVIRDIVSSNSLGNSLRKTLVYVMFFTFVIEIIGAISILLSVHGQIGMSLNEEIEFSVFHSVSAFCNAGFSTLPGNLGNPNLLYGGVSIFYVIISLLVILGGVGFPILVNFKDSIKYYCKNFVYKIFNKPRMQHMKHLYALNTKIVLLTTFLLVIFGTLVFAVLEWNNSLVSFSFGEKIVQSFFNAVIPRTAGFMSVDVSTFNIQTILMIIFLMWIGGSSQSTAGGIKVNTFAVSIVNLFSVFRNSADSKIFGRTISPDSIRRANATLIASLLLLTSAIFVLTFTDAHLSIKAIVFECFSALGTVGSSLNATMSLTSNGKIVIIFLMFVGRVGIITLVMGMFKSKQVPYKFPSESIIIN